MCLPYFRVDKIAKKDLPESWSLIVEIFTMLLFWFIVTVFAFLMNLKVLDGKDFKKFGNPIVVQKNK